MPKSGLMRNESWLSQPVSLGGSTIRAAGQVRDVPGLNPQSMRIMGSFGLIYMVDVQGYYEDAKGTKSVLRSGDVVWIHPGLAHAYGPDEGRSWTQIYLILEGSHWEQWAQEGVLNIRQPVTHAEPVDYWYRRMADLFQPREVYDKAATLRMTGATIQLVTDLLATQDDAHRSADDRWLAESQRLLGERLAVESLTPQQVARQVGLSYESFRKRFAEKTGVSPGQFRQRRRIEHACAAIYQGSANFKDLADQLGFCDVFHFSKTFRQITKETPSDFRRRVRGS